LDLTDRYEIDKDDSFLDPVIPSSTFSCFFSVHLVRIQINHY